MEESKTMTSTDLRLQAKITYLQRLLNIYVKFLKYYSEVEITVKTNTINVKYQGEKNGGYKFQSIEFPATDLNKRILHYKQKVRTAIKNRHKTNLNT